MTREEKKKNENNQNNNNNKLMDGLISFLHVSNIDQNTLEESSTINTKLILSLLFKTNPKVLQSLLH